MPPSPNPIKHVLIINYEYPPVGGGSGVAAHYLAQELNKLGVQITVLTSAFQNLPKKETQNGCTIIRTPVFRRQIHQSNPIEMLTFIISAALKLLPLAKKTKPNISIAFFGIPGGPLGLWLKLIYNIPYLISLRGGDVPGSEHKHPIIRLFTPGLRFLWRQAQAVIANSVGLRDLAVQTAGEIPILTIPNGVDTNEFYPHPRKQTNKKRQATDKTPQILFVGRVVYQKGLDTLLHALQHDSLANTNLTIVGEGEDRAELEKLTRDLQLTDRVVFTGWRTREQLLGFYHDADIFVLPSRGEGMPNVVLEAMACGLPVAATRIPGSVDLVQHDTTGFLTPVGDVNALQLALQQLVENKQLRAKMGSAGRKFVEQHYSWKRTAEAYLSIITQTCNNQSGVEQWKKIQKFT